MWKAGGATRRLDRKDVEETAPAPELAAALAEATLDLELALEARCLEKKYQDAEEVVVVP